MADIKTHLRELSVATTIGLLISETKFEIEELFDAKKFYYFASNVIANDISKASNILSASKFEGELKQIIINGYNLGVAIYNNRIFSINKDTPVLWQGCDTQKDDPVDIVVGRYGFSLKEESFILENMGLYKLLNCFTGSNYKKRHIFKDYALQEYKEWFNTTWRELIAFLIGNGNEWRYYNSAKQKTSVITLCGDSIYLELIQNGSYKSVLPVDCTLEIFEKRTTSKTREQVFSKFINMNLDANEKYNNAKRICAIAATEALSHELYSNLNYRAGLPRFLRIHEFEYYYAKSTSAGIQIFKVPSISAFGNEIIIESIKSSVPDKQANILTTIKNTQTGKKLILRNECRFSHGQFNGTPEAKMYYEHGGSLDTIYEIV